MQKLNEYALNLVIGGGCHCYCMIVIEGEGGFRDYAGVSSSEMKCRYYCGRHEFQYAGCYDHKQNMDTANLVKRILTHWSIGGYYLKPFN